MDSFVYPKILVFEIFLIKLYFKATTELSSSYASFSSSDNWLLKSHVLIALELISSGFSVPDTKVYYRYDG
jgi:hypothetical protein